MPKLSFDGTQGCMEQAPDLKTAQVVVRLNGTDRHINDCRVFKVVRLRRDDMSSRRVTTAILTTVVAYTVLWKRREVGKHGNRISIPILARNRCQT